MVYGYVLLLFLVSLFSCKLVETKSEIRKKRILFGIPGYTDDRDNYPSFRYFVFLGKGPLLDKVADRDWLAYWMGMTSPIPSQLHCGGALLTPSIVQTACHCIANFYMSGKPGSNVSAAFPMDVWEDPIYSYFGSNLAIEMWDMLRPKHYVVYSKCRKLEGVAQIGMFDYGLIISGDTVVDKNPEAQISYAPAYRAKEMLQFYYEAIQKEFMCLLIGHGPYQTDANLMVDPEPSNEIRWGWRTVMSYIDCLSVSYSIEHRRRYTFDYLRDSTWVCAQAFSARTYEYYLNTEGDSGGPMTCNDVYFSVFSMTTDIDDGDNVISYSGPIVRTPFENAAEYRDALVRFVNDFVHSGRPQIYPEDPDVIPTSPPEGSLFPMDLELIEWDPIERSAGIRRINNSPLVILCKVVYTIL